VLSKEVWYEPIYFICVIYFYINLFTPKQQQEKQNAEPEVYVDTAVSLQPSEMEEALNFCNDVFSAFSGWVYNAVEEKWKIGVKV
jgi:hypothetical protein